MAQILESAGGPPALLPTLVTLFSTGNLLGRLLAVRLSPSDPHTGPTRTYLCTCTSTRFSLCGTVRFTVCVRRGPQVIPSDALVRRGWPRPLFLAAIALLAATAHLALLTAARVGGTTTTGSPPLSLDASDGGSSGTPLSSSSASAASPGLQSALLQGGAICGGLAFGALWPHFVVLASELFGSLHLATNCACHARLAVAIPPAHTRSLGLRVPQVPAFCLPLLLPHGACPLSLSCSHERSRVWA